MKRAELVGDQPRITTVEKDGYPITKTFQASPYAIRQAWVLWDDVCARFRAGEVLTAVWFQNGAVQRSLSRVAVSEEIAA